METRFYTSAIEACLICAQECQEASRISQEREIKMMDKIILFDQNCSDMCELTAALLSKNTKQVQHIARECARSCEACAAVCEQQSEAFLKKCANACKKAARECRKLLLNSENLGYAA